MKIFSSIIAIIVSDVVWMLFLNNLSTTCNLFEQKKKKKIFRKYIVIKLCFMSLA